MIGLHHERRMLATEAWNGDAIRARSRRVALAARSATGDAAPGRYSPEKTTAPEEARIAEQRTLQACSLSRKTLEKMRPLLSAANLRPQLAIARVK
jgi:hypothetical protein